ncbi:23S rRNA (uracil(1939)-C(5))-methyltransferase RlmD [Vibrio sonorensis]|uniref:23S rRNA (uracil(1939)-C(5))-methyltransferase RlmD n=1 Tax=Vibrio sonorensis TaxID=1004316 RepID=UPI0008DA5CA3|nr:23S rRNA (uracil(1939)-C(5))-methyltransferase RlmD [Vibrio sonorensis]
MARFYQAKKKTDLNTKHQAFKIEKIDHHGAGIAFSGKKPVFIDGALIGEDVLAQLTESKSKYARARLIKVLKPSKQRQTPFCQHFGECGGCNMQHLNHQSQIEYKEQSLSELMKKFSGDVIALNSSISEQEKGYRRRARFSLLQDKKTQTLQFGFRKRQSKQIVQITDCPVLEPELNQLLPDLYQLLKTVKPLSSLGHVELVKGDNGLVLLLRHTPSLSGVDKERIEAFAKQKNLTLFLNHGEGAVKAFGETPYYQEIGVQVPFTPENFIQVNQKVNQKMVEQAIEWLELVPQDRVLDLFCGLGNFTLPLAKATQHVVGVEGIDEMVVSARANAKLNQLENVEFYHANLEQALIEQPWIKETFNKVLLDPARAGASGIIEQMSTLGAKQVLYVSCNPATLARDSQSLLKQGYSLSKLGMLDMFPHTSHLESMALFTKA